MIGPAIQIDRVFQWVGFTHALASGACLLSLSTTMWCFFSYFSFMVIFLLWCMINSILLHFGACIYVLVNLHRMRSVIYLMRRLIFCFIWFYFCVFCILLKSFDTTGSFKLKRERLCVLLCKCASPGTLKPCRNNQLELLTDDVWLLSEGKSGWCFITGGEKFSIVCYSTGNCESVDDLCRFCPIFLSIVLGFNSLYIAVCSWLLMTFVTLQNVEMMP